MNYTTARPQIKSGDLLAWSHRAPFWRSWADLQIALVRLFTRSEYSHVGTAVVLAGRVLVIEAVQPRVRLHPLSQLGDFYWLPLGASWTPNAEAYAFAQLGDSYSTASAMFGFFGMPSDDKCEQCAELKIRIARAAGIDLGTVATPTAVVRGALELGAPMRYITH